MGAVKDGKRWTRYLTKRQNHGMMIEKTVKFASMAYLRSDFVNRPGTFVPNGVFGQPRYAPRLSET